jgi:hypothetical protein
MAVSSLVSSCLVVYWTGCTYLRDYRGEGQVEGWSGDEYVADEEGGVVVVCEEYEGMCHDFVVYLSGLSHSATCLDILAGFARRCVEEEAGLLRAERWRVDVETLRQALWSS